MLLTVWATGSALVAYRLGAPWLHGRGGADPIVEAASAPAVVAASHDANFRIDTETQARIAALDARINDAIARIDALTHQAPAHEESRTVASTRGAGSHAGPSALHDADSAHMPREDSIGPAGDGITPSWIISGLIAGLIANAAFAVLLMAEIRRRRRAIPQNAAASAINGAVTGAMAAAAQLSRASPLPSAPAVPETADTGDVENMIAAMRSAGLSGLHAPSQVADAGAMRRVTSRRRNRSERSSGARSLDVATENRRCARFADRMSDENHASMAGEAGAGRSAAFRSVA